MYAAVPWGSIAGTIERVPRPTMAASPSFLESFLAGKVRCDPSKLQALQTHLADYGADRLEPLQAITHPNAVSIFARAGLTEAHVAQLEHAAGFKFKVPTAAAGVSQAKPEKKVRDAKISNVDRWQLSAEVRETYKLLDFRTILLPAEVLQKKDEVVGVLEERDMRFVVDRCVSMMVGYVPKPSGVQFAQVGKLLNDLFPLRKNNPRDVATARSEGRAPKLVCFITVGALARAPRRRAQHIHIPPSTTGRAHIHARTYIHAARIHAARVHGRASDRTRALADAGE